MAAGNKFGQLQQIDYFNNVGGINLTDTVFKIAQDQAAGGYNFDYVQTGGIRKRLGNYKLNSSPFTNTSTLGFGLYQPVSGISKTLFRAAGRQLETFDTSSLVDVSLTQDNAAVSNTPFASGTTQDVAMLQFSTGTSDILWGAGGGSTNLVGAYSTSKYTLNGSMSPSGPFSGVVNLHNGGSWSSGNHGLFFYSFVLRKQSTQALSNASQDFSVTTTNTDDTVTITLTPPSDTTLYDQVWIYRSSLNGVSGFTTGSLIAQLPSTATQFIDMGDLGNPDILSAQNLPRSASIVVDNSQLPSGTYNTLALWGHRLCTSSGNQLYISDVNKSESWPLTNYITVPSAGPITALSTISFTSPQANSLQELLVIFKERELWVLIPGSSWNYTTWTLMKVDGNVGCPDQQLLVSVQGFLAWVDYRGIWIWDGTSKPIYLSRPIEALFGTGGDLDKSQFSLGVGVFVRRDNQIVWYLSSKTYGTQMYAIKMDVRQTMLKFEQLMVGRVVDGVFLIDILKFPVYAALSYLPFQGQNEQLILGDYSGFVYFGSFGQDDGGSAYSFKYVTSPITASNPNTMKLWHKVVVWVQNLGGWNLTLDYWPMLQNSPFLIESSTLQSTISLPLNTANPSPAVWDLAEYDVSQYNGYYPDVVPLVFNLQSGSINSSQGYALQLQFRNDNSSQPITIHGFSVIYSELGGVTA